MYIRKSTWSMYIILAIIIIAAGLLTKTFDETNGTYEGDQWREQLETENEALIKEDEEVQQKMEENEDEFIVGPDMSIVDKNTYYLEHDIQPTAYGASEFVMENAVLLSIVSLFTIIIAAGIVANEFRWGTIKLLLIRPISRSVILLAKYISVLIFSFITLLFVLLFSWIVGAILFGIDGLNPHTLIYANDFDMDSGFRYVSIIKEIIADYGYQLVNLVMMATFAFMVSTIFRNSALAIGIAIFLMMAGNQIVFFLSEHAWAKYILFANTDLSQYAAGSEPIIVGMTLSFSIGMLLLYYSVFMILSWVFFTKRDVAGQ